MLRSIYYNGSFELLVAVLLLSACGESAVDAARSKREAAQVANTAEQVPKSSLFQQIPSTSSGVTFNNRLQESEAINFYRYQYLYNGGGVAIGDINNDGLDDIYFTGTIAEDKLYLNKGGLKFEDISTKAGLSGFDGVKTGVTMTDVDQDGWLDIYVCRSGWFKDPEKRENLLFRNNQDGTFTESAANFGLNESGHSIQSVFFDHDRDGDLDMFVTNHRSISSRS